MTVYFEFEYNKVNARENVLPLLMPHTPTLLSLEVSVASLELDKLVKGLLELIVEGCVDHRVDKRVEIAEPGEEVKQHWVEPTLLTDSHDQCPYKEGQPADNEGS